MWYSPHESPLLAVTTALLATAIAAARDPLITSTFPVPGEIRAPDRTLSNKTPISQVAYSADGRSLATLGTDGKVRIWEARTGEQGTGALQQEAEPNAAHLEKDAYKFEVVPRDSLLKSIGELNTATAVAISASDVAAGFADGTVKLWHRDGTAPRVIGHHPAAVRAVAFSAKGDQLASGGDDRLVNVWDVGTNTLLCVQTGHASPISAIVFNPNGQKMASVDTKGVINYWTTPLPPRSAEELANIKAAVPTKATATPKKSRRILVFWRADAILHKGGVPAANQAIQWMGEKTGAYTTEFSRDYAALNPDVLARYDAIVLNSTAHLAIPPEAKEALIKFAQRGGGVVGIHAAIDTFKPSPDAAAIIGATFGGHPWHPTGTWAVKLDEPNHPLNRAWAGKNFKMHDELYVMSEPYLRGDRRVLLAMDMSDPSTANPGNEKPERERTDGDFAIAWIKRFGAGRVFYGGFGHLSDPFANPAVLQFYLDGIQYVLGDLTLDPKDDAPSSP